jgi:hypothetical protein
MQPLPAITEETVRYEEAMRERQRYALYPALLGTPLKAPTNVIYSRLRQGSGALTVAIRQDALTEQQQRELGEFRLHQYALCGWYDVPTLASNGLTTDPALPGLPAATIHVLVGGSDGRLLAYFCMQPAAHIHPASGRLLRALPEFPSTPHTGTTLRDPGRPLYGVEVESFGPDVFPSLPALASLPMRTILELSCLIRNQSISSPLTTIATLEAVYTVTHIAMQPDSEIQAALGCLDIEARRVMMVMGIPFLYAPLAPVILEQFDYYWSRSVNTPGRFWPSVVATEDLLAHAEHFTVLDQALSGSPRDLRRTLVRLHHNPPQFAPHAFVPSADETEIYWTDDPYYAPPLLKPTSHPATVVPRTVR